MCYREQYNGYIYMYTLCKLSWLTCVLNRIDKHLHMLHVDTFLTSQLVDKKFNHFMASWKTGESIYKHAGGTGQVRYSEQSISHTGNNLSTSLRRKSEKGLDIQEGS